MARLLPSLPSTSVSDDAEPRVIGLDSTDADDLIGALSSRTARRILASLHEGSASASELADAVDSSLQNVQYHLGRMTDAGLVEVVDTAYSEKGREMKLYAPTDRPLVVVAASDTETEGLRSLLTRLLGAVGLLALLSLVVQLFFGGASTSTAGGAAGSADGAEAARVAAETTATGVAASAGLPPGLLFFAGGLVVLLAVAGIRLVRARRRGEE